MVKVSVIGATGYVGYELVRLLSSHPEVHIAGLITSSSVGEALSATYASLLSVDLPPLEEMNIDTLAANSDVVFVSLPHGASKDVVPQLFARGVKVIDMSGDYRYLDPQVYSQWYGLPHPMPELQPHCVYGLPELHRNAIQATQIVANPGCYTTASILALAPLLEAKCIDPDSIIIDAKSGSTGAGRKLTTQIHFCELDGNMKAYGVTTHRHTSEIEQELSLVAGLPIQVSFTPHLLPVKRGILATCYAKLAKPCNTEDVLALFEARYAEEPFVAVCKEGSLPELKDVVGSNNIHIGCVVDRRLNRVVIVSCIDNLIKGAAGQGIQNMNLLFGLPEKMGLAAPAWYL